MDILRSIILTVIERTRFVVSMNNKYMSVSSTAGVMSLACGGVVVYQLCQKKIDWHIVRGCGIGAGVFWSVYLYLDSRNQEKERELRKSFASSSSQNGNVTTFDDREAPEIDKYEKMQSLQETINNTDENVVNLAGDMLIKGGTLVVFGQKGVGKSTLVMQIAYSIAKGEVCDILPSNEVAPLPPQIVLYYDNEMSVRQMKRRYGKSPIPEKLKWSHCNFFTADQWLDNVEIQVSEENLKEDATIIIDNITKCGTGFTQPDVVNRMWKRIEDIQAKCEQRGIYVTFILVAHTNVLDTKDKPLSTNDLSGSANLGNFSPSLLGVGRTRYKGHVLLKLFNSRDTPEPDKVTLLKRNSTPTLSYTKVALMNEKDVLPYKDGHTRIFTANNQPCVSTYSRDEELKELLKELPKSGPGSKIPDEVIDRFIELKEAGHCETEIAEMFGRDRCTINRLIKKRKKELSEIEQQDMDSSQRT